MIHMTQTCRFVSYPILGTRRKGHKIYIKRSQVIDMTHQIYMCVWFYSIIRLTLKKKSTFLNFHYLMVILSRYLPKTSLLLPSPVLRSWIFLFSSEGLGFFRTIPTLLIPEDSVSFLPN